MGQPSQDAGLPDDPQEGQSASNDDGADAGNRPARPSFRDRLAAGSPPAANGGAQDPPKRPGLSSGRTPPAAGSEPSAAPERPSRLSRPAPSGTNDGVAEASDEGKPARRSFADRLGAAGTERPARPAASIPPPPVGASASSEEEPAAPEESKPARRSFGDKLSAASEDRPARPTRPISSPPTSASSDDADDGEAEPPAAEAPAASAPATPAEKPKPAPRAPVTPRPATERPAPEPRAHRSFGAAMGEAAPAKRPVSALDQERLARLQNLQSQGGAVSTSFQKMVSTMRSKSASSPTPSSSRSPAADVTIENKPDYVDILCHVDARTKVHEEYQEILEQYGPRLFTGGEVLAGALIGLNASLIDTVHRRLAMNSRFPVYVEFKEIALKPLLVVTENGQQTEIELDLTKPTIIGRGSDCTKQLQSQFVSRHHISIVNKAGEKDPPIWWVEDLQSTHGTTLNETQVIAPEKVRPGDVIKVGANYGAPDHPRLEIIYRAKNYSKSDLEDLLKRVDIVIAVAQADHVFEGQKVFLNNLHALQSNGAMVVLAVSRSKEIDEEIEINVDDLRQAANITLGRKTRRHLTTVYEKAMSEGEWIDEIYTFIDSFKELALDDVVQMRRKNTRQEVVDAIVKVGSNLRPSIESALAEAQRKRSRVEDEITGAPRALQGSEAFRDDSFKELKQVVDDDSKDYSNDIKPDSLTYYAQSLVDSAPYITRKGAKMMIDLVVPGTEVKGQQPQPPHHWIIHNMREHARLHYAKLRGEVVGRNASPPGVAYILRELRTGLAANDKVRDQNLFDADRYERYEVPELARRIEQKIAGDFVHGESATSEKIDNMFTYLVTKTRYAFMFYLSLFTIIGIFGGISFRQEFKTWVQKQPPALIWPGAVIILGLLGYSNYRAYKSATKDRIEEEITKIRDKAKKHYAEAAKVVIDDVKRELLKHVTEQETDVKRVMGTLGSTRMSESMMQRNNPALDAARQECDYIESQIVMIDQEKDWAKMARNDYTESPFYEDPNARARPRLGTRR